MMFTSAVSLYYQKNIFAMEETKAWSRDGFHIRSRSAQGNVSLNHLVHILENHNWREISCQSIYLLWNY